MNLLGMELNYINPFLGSLNLVSPAQEMLSIGCQFQLLHDNVSGANSSCCMTTTEPLVLYRVA